jgi:hypothetical protein
MQTVPGLKARTMNSLVGSILCLLLGEDGRWPQPTIVRIISTFLARKQHCLLGSLSGLTTFCDQ